MSIPSTRNSKKQLLECQHKEVLPKPRHRLSYGGETGCLHPRFAGRGRPRPAAPPRLHIRKPSCATVRSSGDGGGGGGAVVLHTPLFDVHGDELEAAGGEVCQERQQGLFQHLIQSKRRRARGATETTSSLTQRGDTTPTKLSIIPHGQTLQPTTRATK